MFPEPHSTKQVEDAVTYGLDGSPAHLVMDDGEPVATTGREVEAICRQVRCPVRSSRATATTASRSSAGSPWPS